jgi:2-keto-4-pentenoate hydratase
MDPSLIQSFAAQLIRGLDAHTQLEPFTQTHPDFSLADAYRVQREYVAMRRARGERVIGKKLAATGKTLQQAFQIQEPLFAFLFDAFVMPENQPLAFANFFDPRLEPELAFVMKDRLAGPGVTVDDVLRATEGVRPAFEIPDGVFTSRQIPVANLVAANVFGRGIVLGEKMTTAQNLDLFSTGVVVEKNGAIIATSATAAVMASPARAVAWLANALAAHAAAIEAGDIILTGSTTPMLEIQPGDAFVATFGSGIGSVRAKFV